MQSLVWGKGNVITSLGFIFIIALFKLSGTPSVTNPAPERIAAPLHKTAAPENRGEPAKIKMCPKSPLWALGLLCNNSVGNRIIFHMGNRNMYIYLLAPAI